MGNMRRLHRDDNVCFLVNSLFVCDRYHMFRVHFLDCTIYLECISLLQCRLPKLHSQCYSNGLGSLGNPGSNKEIQP